MSARSLASPPSRLLSLVVWRDIVKLLSISSQCSDSFLRLAFTTFKKTQDFELLTGVPKILLRY
ncbi:hypothetical protein E2C01_097316 [Portunus trituberculatus]|uniref:Uncharacterized protein n=1 Tax=Portunus trituberculatus TaxID=210409 RepID=A0A5B7K040_PORTR|nr:hypothetical protein [Portunus trituberculatus]